MSCNATLASRLSLLLARFTKPLQRCIVDTARIQGTSRNHLQPTNSTHKILDIGSRLTLRGNSKY